MAANEKLEVSSLSELVRGSGVSDHRQEHVSADGDISAFLSQLPEGA